METEKSTTTQSFTENLPNGNSFEMIYVEGGEFMMGSEEEEADDDEKPVHKVKLSSFFIGEFPVTQALWKAVMGAGNNPSYWKGDKRPVEMVSWEDAQEFCQKLKVLTKKSYRLLTEAEWEYAARGGALSKEYKYAGSNQLKEAGWYNNNSYEETHAVGEKYPNELGIYDMSGNIWEWVDDQWHDNYKGAPADGSTWIDSDDDTARVVRGGSWLNAPRNCRCSNRGAGFPQNRNFDLGFRLGLSFQSGG